MKLSLLPYYIIGCILALSACNNDNDSSDSKRHDIQVRYSSSDPQHPGANHHFYIYNEADSLVLHINSQGKEPLLSLQRGKYKIIALENISSDAETPENYNTINIKQSLKGDEDIFVAFASFDVPSEDQVSCFFIRLCGGIAIVQHPDYYLYPGSTTHFTFEITRPEGALLFPTTGISQDEVTIRKENIPINGTASNDQIMYLFPMSSDTPVYLSLTFYDKNNNQVDKWEFEDFFPVEAEKLTGLYMNLSQTGKQPFNIEIRQNAFENINLYLFQEGYVEIRDEQLRKALKNSSLYYEFDEQDKLNRNSIVVQQTTSIGFVKCGLKDVSQLAELFPNLTSLNLEVNEIEELDLSKFPKLEYLSCYSNQIKELHVEYCPNLKILECYKNQIESLDVTPCTSLTKLWCFDNQLKELDLSHNTLLTSLQCFNNSIETLTINAPNTLDYIYAYNNRITSLDVKDHKKLMEISCSHNALKNVNISGCENLYFLYLSHNQLTDFKIKDIPLIQKLYLSHNNLQELDLTSCLNVREVLCDSNQLTTIKFADATTYENLYHFYCHGPDQKFTDIPTFKPFYFPAIMYVYLPLSAIDGPTIKDAFWKRPYENYPWYYQDINGDFQNYQNYYNEHN